MGNSSLFTFAGKNPAVCPCGSVTAYGQLFHISLGLYNLFLLFASLFVCFLAIWTSKSRTIAIFGEKTLLFLQNVPAKRCKKL
jgi:hypothetical protein